MHIHSDALKKKKKKSTQLSYIFVGFAHYSDTITLLLKIFVLEINRLF